MSMIRRSPKVSEKKNNKALKTAIENKVDYFKEFYIENNVLYIKLDRIKLNERNAASNLRLPSYKEIHDSASSIYKNFKRDDIVNICYVFEFVTFNGTANISPYFCDVIFSDCHILGNLFIFGGDLITIDGCSLICHPRVEIESKSIEIKDTDLRYCETIHTNSDEINIIGSTLTSTNNVDINSSIMTFNNTKFKGMNIDLQCDLIDAENTNFNAEYDINIKCKYNEEVKGIVSRRVIYNGVDITYSDGIARPRLLKQLLEDLKKAKDIINNYIVKDIEETDRIRRETLEDVPITKILNRNNK